ncbi:MAG: LysR family transcriptional regulator [Pseudomonadota bacterium]
MKFEHLKLFVRVASTQNISSAGNDLGLSPAVASSYVSKLEKQLGVRLIHRTTRKVSLTEEGRVFLPYAEEVLAGVDAARASVGAGSTSPSGLLRVTAPASFGRMHLMPALKTFLDQNPNLDVDLRLSDTITDLVEGGFDVAIRNSSLKDSSLIARKLASDRRILCASPDYLQQHGHPESPEDLKQHQCITLMGLDYWTFKVGDGEKRMKAKGRFRTDNGDAIREACVSGLGITINSTWSAYAHLQQGDLVEVLNRFPLISESAIWAVYPGSRILAPKVRVFIDFFARHFGDEPYWDLLHALRN